jgi:CBS domain-containing protein
MTAKRRRVAASFESAESADEAAAELEEEGVEVERNAPDDTDLAFAATLDRGDSAERPPATTVAAELVDDGMTTEAVETLHRTDADVVAVGVDVERDERQEQAMNENQIRELMTPFPKCLSTVSDVEEAARLMAYEDIGDVFVCEGDRIVGIVTDRDIVVRAVAQGRDCSTTRLADIASAELATISPTDAVDDAVSIMRSKALRRLPVVDDEGAPMGVVTLGDLARELDPRSALADISAAPANV